jgi:predicted ATPase
MVCAIPLHLRRQEWQTAQEQAEALITFSLEYGFPLRVAQGTINRGYTLVAQGSTEEGSAQIREGLATYRATGAELDWPGYLSGLAWAYGKMGRTDEGLAMLTEALDVVHKTGQRPYEAELSRLKGELMLQQSSVQGLTSSVQRNQRTKDKGQKAKIEPSTQAKAEAEACFLKAIDIARQQQAKSLELRAAMSLSRLWRQQGKTKQAHNMLAEIYGWFTEGFDTQDLQEAKALLEELG